MYYLRIVNANSWLEPRYGSYLSIGGAKEDATKIAKEGFWDEGRHVWYNPLFIKRIIIVDKEKEEEEKGVMLEESAKMTKIIRKKQPWYRRWLRNER